MNLKNELRGYAKPVAESVLAILIGAFIGALVLWFSGYSPLEAYYWLIVGSLASTDGIAETLAKSAPL
ncbi:MAG: ABC transporter permease, partial [Thermococcus sp.]